MNARFVGGPLDGQEYQNHELPQAVEFHSSEALRHYQVSLHDQPGRLITGFLTVAPSVTHYRLMKIDDRYEYWHTHGIGVQL